MNAITATQAAELLVAAAVGIWEGADIQVSINIAVSERLKSATSKDGGLDLQQVFITDSDMRHIKNRHGSGEDALGQIDITPEDFAMIPIILSEYDELIRGEDDKLGNARFMLTKNLSGTVYLATVQRGKKKLEVRTFYKRKPGAS
ncbi:MAG: hypothetical protein LBL86_11865 [Coriobacteriales bacterium]|jgi:hypothetical protein|nr:hypothetical protein [Coriobacteriales bacterium]